VKTYKYRHQIFGFQMSIPDDWSDSPMVDVVNRLSHNNESKPNSASKNSDSWTIIGPNSNYLNILITPLSANEPEPTINQTAGYYNGLSLRQDLNVIATGAIFVAEKEHFWATYHRGSPISLVMGGQIQFFKKYCLYLNRVEYLITAGMIFVSPGDKLPTDQDIRDREKIFDEMVSSIHLSNT
jgi:hypothetical protein